LRDCRLAKRRSSLSRRADALFTDTEERLLPFDARAADRCGEVVAARQNVGRPISVPDAIIANIAGIHRASLATRNVRDFDDCGIQVVNP
jgi:predicted nucleic acid-binding protein